MEFNIQVVQLDKQTKPTTKGSYQQLEVAFKNLSSGKLESKKLMSFTKPDTAFKALVEAKQGDVFTITSEKNSSTGYWDWTSAVPNIPGDPQQVSTTTTVSKGNAAPKSTYETPEERAKKQVYIVKQSSLTAAIAILIHNNPKAPVSVDAVKELAQEFTDFVFGVPAQVVNESERDLFQQPNEFPDVE